MLGVYISNADLVTLATYAPLGVVAVLGIQFAMRTKRRLSLLEDERTEARNYSSELQRKVQEIAEHMSITEKEIMGIIRGIAAQKVTRTPISDEDVADAADMISKHQAEIEKLLGE